MRPTTRTLSAALLGKSILNPEVWTSLSGRARAIAVPASALAMGVLILWLLQSLSRQLDYHAVVHLLRTTPLTSVLVAGCGMILSYLALIARDVSTARRLRLPIGLPTLAFGAVCGSALGNALGFGTLTGGAVRFRVYRGTGTRAENVARLMLLLGVSFAAGLIVFAACSAVVYAPSIAALLSLQPTPVRMTGSAMLLGSAIGYAMLFRRNRLERQLGDLPVGSQWLRFSLTQLALVAIDLIGAGLALWALLPNSGVGFGSFMAVYAAAIALGVLSHVPGGLGVFEAAVVFALGGSVGPSEVAAALLAYRVIYFFLPLLVSAALLAAVELRAVTTRAPSPALVRIRRGVGQLAPVFLSTITFVAGSMLMLSGATPAFSHRLAILQTVLPLWTLEASQFLSSLLGVLLLFVARGLLHRLDGAWWVAMVLTCSSLVLSLAKGLAFNEAAVLSTLVLLLAATRRRFDQPASLVRETFTLSWFIAVGIVVALSVLAFLFAFHDTAYCRGLWWEFAFDAKAPRALRATFASAACAGLIALWQLLRLAPGHSQPPTRADLAAAWRIIREQDRSDALLAMMGDKSLLFSASDRAFLMYAKRGRSWIALYDPVGPREEWPELILRFVATAASHGGRAAFYQVRPPDLILYLDAGLKIMKLGEDARIPLDSFTLTGSRWSHLRYAIKRGERDGLQFRLIERQDVETLVPVLREISDAWLRHRGAREKGFSVASFKQSYLATQAVALVCQNGRPVAFATLMTTDLQSEATVGVMRYTPDSSEYAMEFLFTSLGAELKRAGYSYLSLGMAPLAGLAATPLSSWWHRVGNLLWRHGGRIYDFQGLRRFKGKFNPVWEPRYLAASGTVGPFVTLADVAVLSGKHETARPCAA